MRRAGKRGWTRGLRMAAGWKRRLPPASGLAGLNYGRATIIRIGEYDSASGGWPQKHLQYAATLFIRG